MWKEARRGWVESDCLVLCSSLVVILPVNQVTIDCSPTLLQLEAKITSSGKSWSFCTFCEFQIRAFWERQICSYPCEDALLLSLRLCCYFLVIISGKAPVVSGFHVRKPILTTPFCFMCLVTLRADMFIKQLFYCRTLLLWGNLILLATGQFATVNCVSLWPHKRESWIRCSGFEIIFLLRGLMCFQEKKTGCHYDIKIVICFFFPLFV